MLAVSNCGVTDIMSERTKSDTIRNMLAALSAAAVVASLTYAVPAAATGNDAETREQAEERCGENAEPVWTEPGWQCVETDTEWSEFMTDENGEYARDSSGRIVPLCSQKAISAAQDRGWGVCHPTDSHLTSARYDSSAQQWVRSTEPPPRPIRTIIEGQSTTFTAPVPDQRAPSATCTSDEGWWTRGTDGTLHCHTPDDTLSYGPCVGPYTVDVLTEITRASPSGGSIRVVTDANDGQDDTGTMVIGYLLRGTRTVGFKQNVQYSPYQSTSQSDCTLAGSVRVEVRMRHRRGISAAIDRFTPDDHLLRQDSFNKEIRTEDCYPDCGRTRVWDTPRGCKVLVSYNGTGGFGQTNCMTSYEIAVVEAILNNTTNDKDVDMSSLPECTEEMASQKVRCVATN